jgi:2Fe-2S ferredoxin
MDKSFNIDLDSSSPAGSQDSRAEVRQRERGETSPVAKVTYVRSGNDDVIVEVADGVSVMQAAVANGVTEIVAECGGTLACATCHVYLDEADVGRAGEISPDEDEMLDFTASPRAAGSRLSCQIVVSAELDGIVVRAAPEQY